MHSIDFLSKYRSKLIAALEGYLFSKVSNDEIQQIAWEIISEGVSIPKNEPYAPGEETFWASVWAIQHMADDQHQTNESVRTQLIQLFEALESYEPLPECFVGKRP
jgi:hypothetical protein